MIEILRFIFNVCIGVGICIPLLDVLLGFIGSILNVDFEIGDHQIGDMFDFSGDGQIDADSSLPINIMCLCFSLVVFGALGRLATCWMVNIFAVIVCLLCLLGFAAGAYALLYKFVVKPLKKSNPRAINHWDLLGVKGKLVLRITSDSPGLVSLKDSTGAAISYRASAKEDVLTNWDGEIPQGAEVVVNDIDADARIVYVKPLDTFQNFDIKKK